MMAVSSPVRMADHPGRFIADDGFIDAVPFPQKPMRNVFIEPGSGMRDVPMWLKGLRLHKYTGLFQQMDYEQMLKLTEPQLDFQGVTKGARKKILSSVQKLQERVELLKQLENDVCEPGGVRTTIVELRQMVQTPIRPFPLPGRPEPIQARIDGINVPVEEISDDNLPAHFIRVLGKVYIAMFESADTQMEEDCYSTLLQILDRCINHEAFTLAQKRRVVAWKQTVKKVWNPNNVSRRGSFDRSLYNDRRNSVSVKWSAPGSPPDRRNRGKWVLGSPPPTPIRQNSLPQAFFNDHHVQQGPQVNTQMPNSTNPPAAMNNWQMAALSFLMQRMYQAHNYGPASAPPSPPSSAPINVNQRNSPPLIRQQTQPWSMGIDRPSSMISGQSTNGHLPSQIQQGLEQLAAAVAQSNANQYGYQHQHQQKNNTNNNNCCQNCNANIQISRSVSVPQQQQQQGTSMAATTHPGPNMPYSTLNPKLDRSASTGWTSAFVNAQGTGTSIWAPPPEINRGNSTPPLSLNTKTNPLSIGTNNLAPNTPQSATSSSGVSSLNSGFETSASPVGLLAYDFGSSTLDGSERNWSIEKLCRSVAEVALVAGPPKDPQAVSGGF